MAESPNYMAMFLQGQQAGQQQRQLRQRQNALAMYGTDPKGAENALMAAGDVETANALTQRRQAQAKIDTEAATVKRRAEVGTLATTDPAAARNAALQAGDMDLAETVGKLDDAKKAALARANAQVGGIAYHLLQEKDPQARQQLAAAAIPILKQQGVLPQDAEVDLSDAGLQTYVSQAMELKDILAQGNADRTFKLTQANTEADNKRADMTASEAARHNRADEGLSGARLNLARSSEARQAREGSGGGKAPSGYRYKPDGSLAYIPGGPADPETKMSTLKVVPQKVASGLAENRTAMSKIDRAMSLVDKYPQGLGLANKLGDTIRQRTDPNGVDVRAAIADIGSQKLHDRSGANVTVSESPRLVPFIPKVDDNPATVKKKLRQLRYEYESMVNQTEQLYAEDNGYRSSAPKAASGGQADPLGIR